MKPLKTTIRKCIESQDLDDLVVEVYRRPYCFQQQDGRRPRGDHIIVWVPSEPPYDYEATQIKEEINGFEIGVSFATWLERDPKLP